MPAVMPRQLDCLDFIKRSIAQRGYSPSYAEILVAVGLKSKSEVHRLLCGLESRGAIKRTYGRPRSIEVRQPESMQAVLLSKDVFELTRAYADGQHISVDDATNAILRGALMGKAA